MKNIANMTTSKYSGSRNYSYLIIVIMVEIWIISSTAYAQTGSRQVLFEDSELKQHIVTALISNPGLAAQSANVEAARERVSQVSSWQDPTVNFSLKNMPINNLGSNQDGMSGIGVVIGQTVPWAGKLRLKEELSEYNVRVLSLIQSHQELKLAENLAHLWFDWAYLIENLKIMNYHIMLIDNLIVIALSRYETGEGLQQDILRAETMRSKHEDMRINLKQKIKTLSHRFVTSMGIDSKVVVSPPSKLSDAFSKTDHGVLSDQIYRKNPEWKTSQLRIESTERKVDLANLTIMPDLKLDAGYLIRKDSKSGLKRSDLLTLSVGATLPLHRESKQNAAVREMLSLARSAKHRQRSLDLELNFQLKKLLDEDERLSEQILLYKEGVVPQSEATLAAATAAYSVGKADFEAPLSADLMLHDIQLESLSRIRDRLKTRASISALTGGSDLIGSREFIGDKNEGMGK